MIVNAHRLFAAIISRKRGICIWLAFAVFAALSLCPPWLEIGVSGREGAVKTAMGRIRETHETIPYRFKLWHAPIFCNPIDVNRRGPSEVDYPRMLTEIAVGEGFVLALYLTWGRSKGIRG